MRGKIMNKIIETNSIVTLETKPSIKSKIEEVVKEIAKKIDSLKLDSLEPTEDNKARIKEIRAELNKDFKAYEADRKLIKSIINKDYDEFEKEYNNKIKPLFKKTDIELATKVEEIQKAQDQVFIDYAEDYFSKRYESLSKEASFIDFKNIKVNYTNKKQIRESIDKYIDGIENDLKIISLQEDRDLIHAEYLLNGYVLQDSIIKVNERKRLAEQLSKSFEKEEEIVIEEKEEPMKFVEVNAQTDFEGNDDEIDLYEFNIGVTNMTEEAFDKLYSFLEENKYEYTISDYTNGK